ncbi:MAG TPA: AtpZ/AtpI family protein [Saprospiraceae bacterium]|nr:AtpZ/AtpI family protein [Saprospiraceae bacterium]
MSNLPSQPDKSSENSPPKSKMRQKVDAYMRYSGMAFEMAAVMAIAVFAGKKIDDYFDSQKPYFTILFALLGTVAALYLTLKDILFKKKNEDK